MLKVFSRMSDRVVKILIKHSPEQYSNFKLKIKEITEEIRPLDKISKVL